MLSQANADGECPAYSNPNPIRKPLPQRRGLLQQPRIAPGMPGLLKQPRRLYRGRFAGRIGHTATLPETRSIAPRA